MKGVVIFTRESSRHMSNPSVSTFSVAISECEVLGPDSEVGQVLRKYLGQSDGVTTAVLVREDLNHVLLYP